MKMVKKCIIALSVVALLVTTVNAADPSIKKDGNWPWTYKAIDLCEFPVLMDIGHFVQLKECNKRELRLKQVDCSSIGKDKFPCYSDCEEFQVRANFPAIFGGKFTKNDLGNEVLKDTKVYFKDDINQINGGGAWEKLTICMDAWEVQLQKATAGPGEKQKVGTMTINVKPPDSDA
jgi:hypothetical protein